MKCRNQVHTKRTARAGLRHAQGHVNAIKSRLKDWHLNYEVMYTADHWENDRPHKKADVWIRRVSDILEAIIDKTRGDCEPIFFIANNLCKDARALISLDDKVI